MRRTIILAVLLGTALVLGGCTDGPDEVNGGIIATPAPAATPSSASTPAVTSPPGTTRPGPGGGGADGSGSGGGSGPSYVRCTDRTNYAGDPRSNAEINGEGARTGTCPPVRTSPPTSGTGVPYDPGVRCTDQVNYTGDPRSNAEINSIGESTGTCPPVQR